MKLHEIFNPDEEHGAVLAKTGFWGNAGAGSIFLARPTGRIGIAHRSRAVEQPGTFGTVGGAIDRGHTPLRTAVKEAEEEVGYGRRRGDYLRLLDLFESGTFRYTTFLYVVAEEFRAVPNWETQGFDWYSFGVWPEPLHFGLRQTLSKPTCLAIIQEEIQKHASPTPA